MEGRRKSLARFVMVVSGLLLLPAAAWPQTVGSGSIAGVVKDTSGGVLPGVTVEAASPALIEKTHTVVTDGQGQYKIVDLRPGVYTVTFSLTGFATVKREGLELTTAFTATVNAELKVGELAETVTVSGASPTVDVQNVMQQRVISREVSDALPLPSNSGAYVAIIPGATQNTTSNQDVGGNKGENTQQFIVHGSRATDFTRLLDGQFFGTTMAGGNYMASTNPATVQEITVQVAGGITAESETGGAQLNLVPKEGGNTFSGSLLTNFGNRRLQADNLTDALRARGLTTAPFIKQLYDVGGGLGGPIKQDKLWFFASARYWTNSAYQPGNYFNKTQGTLFYTSDLSRPAFEQNYYRETGIRVTWQASRKSKITADYIAERNCNCYFVITQGTFAPEATGSSFYWPNWKSQVRWSYPATNRLLIEAGSVAVVGRLNRALTGGSFDDRSVLELSTNYRYGAPGSAFGSTTSWGYQDFGEVNEKFTVSYITGSHAFKAGLHTMEAWRTANWFIADNLSFTFRNQVPQSVIFWAGPIGDRERQRTIALFAQDQWTVRRLTLNLGLRFDYYNAWIPEQHLAAGPYVPARDFAAMSDVVTWKNFAPRLGAAYDLFGNAKTALKVFLGRYVAFETPSGTVFQNNPVTAMVTSASRTWNDVNGDYIPQQNELGPLPNNKFGTVARTTFYDDSVLHGNRPYSWQGAVSVQHELGPRVSLNVGYFRTWYGNFRVTDNRAVTPADYNPYCILVPVNAGLPGGGGNQLCGLYDVTPAKFGPVNNLVTDASGFGKQTDVFDGVDVTMSARFGKAGMIQGGLGTGREVTDKCFVVDSPQELYNCRVSPPWSAGTQVKFAGVYPLPWDLQASATYQAIPPIPTTASYVATSAEIAPSLGRNLAAGANANATIELIAPSTLYREEWVNQLNVRLTRTFRLGKTRMEPQFDIYNLTNANPVLVINTRYGPAWQNATSILSPRVFKFGVQVTF